MLHLEVHMPGQDRPSGRELKEYIIANVDRAVEENWITVFYQPVIRTYTGEICGMEALARWMDPQYGMISPIDFIGTLEEARLIYKIDSFMINRICEDYARVIKEDDVNIGTVSFNLSRLDFTLCDIHKVIESAIKKYKVPREALRVEITESMMETDSSILHEAIDRFWKRGFRVWMDDFGSGYSSLNVLKDYHFDTLKIDMVFLRSFDTRSREIIRSVVDMAKRLGVHTLAEGVETAEQLEFLKGIGCEKAQGYYIGRPMPFKECYSYIEDSGLVVESAGKRQYYHDIGRVNVLSATPLNIAADDAELLESNEGQVPLAIVEFTGDRIHYLFANESYSETLSKIVGTVADAEKEFESGVNNIKERFSAMFYKAKESGDVVSADFVLGNRLCYAKVRTIAGYPGGNAYLVIMQDISGDTASVKNAKLLDALKSMCYIYENIVSLNLDTGYSEAIYQPNQTKARYHKRPAKEELRQYAREEIYPEDREAYLDFTDLDTMEERLAKTTVGYCSMPFRTRRSDGAYQWVLYSLIGKGDPKDRQVLVCARKLPQITVDRLNKEYGGKSLSSEATEDGANISPEELWENFINNADTPFFWKGTDRRFIGVSRSFLDYFGITSEMVAGRTNEELGFYLNPENAKKGDESVLKRGESIYLSPDTCICKGEIRSVLFSRMPIHQNGRIVGIMGYFVDITQTPVQVEEVNHVDTLDKETGALNFVGLVESLMKYQENYLQEKRDFVMILFSLSNADRYRKTFGSQWLNRLFNKVGKVLKEFNGSKGIIGRINSECFVVVKRSESDEDVRDYVSKAAEEVEKITENDGVSCTPFLASGLGRYSAQGSLQSMFMNAQEELLRGTDN